MFRDIAFRGRISGNYYINNSGLYLRLCNLKEKHKILNLFWSQPKVIFFFSYQLGNKFADWQTKLDKYFAWLTGKHGCVYRHGVFTYSVYGWAVVGLPWWRWSVFSSSLVKVYDGTQTGHDFSTWWKWKPSPYQSDLSSKKSLTPTQTALGPTWPYQVMCHSCSLSVQSQIFLIACCKNQHNTLHIHTQR